MLHIVSFTGHQMSPAHIDPFQSGKQMSETFFDTPQRFFQIIRRRLAQRVEMQSLYPFGQRISQNGSRNTETTSRSTRIIKRRFHIGIFGIDAQTTGNLSTRGRHRRIMVIKLRQRIERDVAAIRKDFGKILIGIHRSIGMCRRSHFLVSETSLEK